MLILQGKAAQTLNLYLANLMEIRQCVVHTACHWGFFLNLLLFLKPLCSLHSEQAPGAKLLTLACAVDKSRDACCQKKIHAVVNKLIQ